MRLSCLPRDLRDIVTQYAWGKKCNETFLLACVACEVAQWDIPEVFIRRYHFDWHEMCSTASPLTVFNANISPEDWFREAICFLLLQMLDFRRRNVKTEGSRLRWMHRLKDDWTTIIPFSAFYLRVLCDESNWKQFGYRALQNIQFVDEQRPNSFF